MNFNLELFPYQREAVDFMKTHPRCINASEMGVGKTVEALKLCQELDLQHVLIICPKTLVSEWFWQIDKILEEDCLTPHENSHYEHRLSGLNLKGPRFVVVNYDLLVNRQCWGELVSVPWDCIILDECHKIKNHKAKRTRAMYLLVPSAPRVVLMSGTPMQNSPADLFPLMHIVNPMLYRSYAQWVENFCKTDIIKLPNGKQFRQIVGAQNTEELRTLLAHNLIRHTKHEVLKDLPDKMYRTVPVELGHERAHYESMEKELFVLLDSGEIVTAPAVIAQLIRLRQICLEPNLLSEEKTSTPSNKTLTVMEIVESTPEQIVIFSCFAQYIRILKRELEKRRISYVSIVGDQKPSERLHSIQEFQNGKARVCLGTVGAMGLGITLTAASTVVFTDLWYNPAVNEQAEDRLHRIGQKNAVTVIDLYCQGTIEDAVHQTVRRKQEMFNEVIGMQKSIETLRRMKREG